MVSEAVLDLTQDRLLEYMLWRPEIWKGIDDKPRIIHSKELSDIISERVGRRVEIDIFDLSTSPYRSHKGPKAEQAMEFMAANGGGAALLITSGSAKKAFEKASEKYSNVQVVNFMEQSKMGSNELIHIIDGENGHPSVSIALPNIWFNPETLQTFWKDLIRGDDSVFPQIARYKGARDYSMLVDLVEENGYERGLDVTNVSNYNLPNPYYYPYMDAIVKGFTDYNLFLAPVGIGEFFSGIQGIMKRISGKCAQLLGVTSYANPMSLEDADKSLAHKLDTPMFGHEHVDVAAAAYHLKLKHGRVNNFKGVSDKEIRWAYDLYQQVIENEHKDVLTSETGCASLAALMDAVKGVDGLEVLGTHRNVPGIRRHYLKDRAVITEPLVIKNDEGPVKILVTNTCGVC